MTHQPPDPAASANDEIAAMRRVVAVLQKLDPAARDRVVGWLFDVYRQPARPPVRAEYLEETQ